MINDIIKIEGKHNYTLFPKFPKVLGEDDDTSFGIVSWTVYTVLEGECTSDSIVIKGDYNEEIDPNRIYTILAKEVEHEKYGKQYQLIFFGELLDLSNTSNQKGFLKTFLTHGQMEEMFKVLENPLKTIAEHDYESLKKVHGVGDYIAQKIVDRYEAGKDYCSVYLELDELGLTPNFIRKLIKRYASPKKIIDIVKNNPYQLSYDVEGIGFKTADKIALNNGMSPFSVERVKGYINYLLADLGENGMSYITAGELIAYIFDEFGGRNEVLDVYEDDEGNITGTNISVALQEMQDEDILVLENTEPKNERRVYLKKYWELESEVAKHLVRIATAENKFECDDWEDVIIRQEELQGWKFTSQQKDGIRAGLDNQIVFITGGAGCVDSDTEYFNGCQWKKISEYEQGEKVLQYNKDGSANLVRPIKYIKQKTNGLWHFKTKYGIDQCLSDNHEVYYITSKNNLYHKTFKEVRENHKKTGFKGKFITTFNYEGEGLPFNEWEIRLKVAIKADGSFSDKNNPNTCFVNLKKQRKQKRLEDLLHKNNINFTVNKSGTGFKRYRFYYTDTEKTYTAKWYKINKKQAEIILDEMFHWDGDFKRKNRWFTTIKSDADFVQFVGSMCGYRVSIKEDDRRGQISRIVKNKEYKRKSIDYIALFSKCTLVSLCRDKRPDHTKTEINEYKTKDGYEYCFTVPSHMLVLRRSGNIFITGNCGKSSLASGILAVLENYSFAQCALSGRAGARLQEITGKEGYTIHRLLRYNPATGFEHNEFNTLPYDIIILDEISLVGGEIFLSLIRAIESGSKLIILGDLGQLEAIGCMNLAKDLYTSEHITTVELTKIHRQAQKSGIILSSNSIREGEQVFDKKFVGELTTGELQDMTFKVTSEKSEIKDMVVDEFKKHYKGSIAKDIMDIQIISPVKSRGKSSVKPLNEAIQEYVNPYDGLKKEIKISYKKEDEESENSSFILREGDKVMNMKNNYRIMNIRDENVFVYNGWIGILEEIDKDLGKAIVYFPIINDKIVYDLYTLKSHIILGYASTAHKQQGSSNKVIIGVVDYSTPPNMRTKELVYTILTRAEKHCTMICQGGAFASAVETSSVSNKNTFLVELIEQNSMAIKN